MLISDRGPTTDQRRNTTQAQLGEFYGVYMNMGEGLGTGAEKLCHRSPPQHGWQFEKPAVSSPDWRLTLPGTSVGFNLFQAARLVYAFLQKSGLIPESSADVTLLF